jgi:hypothetical protein
VAQVSIENRPLLWWDIGCDYEGQIGWGVTFGDTLEEAESNFKNSFPHPEHAIILSASVIPENTGIEAMADVCSKG